MSIEKQQQAVGLFYWACRYADLKILRFERPTPYPDTWPDFWLPDIQAWTDRKGIAVEIGVWPVADDDEDRRAIIRASGIDLVVMDDYRMQHLSVHSLPDLLRLAAGRDNPRTDQVSQP